MAVKNSLLDESSERLDNELGFPQLHANSS